MCNFLLNEKSVFVMRTLVNLCPFFWISNVRRNLESTLICGKLSLKMLRVEIFLENNYYILHKIWKIALCGGRRKLHSTANAAHWRVLFSFLGKSEQQEAICSSIVPSIKVNRAAHNFLWVSTFQIKLNSFKLKWPQSRGFVRPCLTCFRSSEATKSFFGFLGIACFSD